MGRGRIARRRNASRAGALLVPLVAGLTFAGVVSAQTAGTPPVFPTQTFKSWTLDCLLPKAGPSAGKRVCFIHHEARPLADPKHVAARAVIRHTGPDRKLVLIVELPPNTVQASGASAAIDTSPPVAIPLAGCIQQFCYGALELTPALQNAIKVGQQMTLGFTPKDYAKQSVVVPLAGVTAALAALEQTGS